MKSSTILLSLGATTLALPISLNTWYNSLFSHSTYAEPRDIQANEASGQIATGTFGTGFPTGTVTFGTGFPTGTGTATLPTGTSGHHHHHHHHHHGAPPVFTPLSIRYNLAPTIAPEDPQSLPHHHTINFPAPTATGSFPTGATVFPTGTSAPSSGPTATGSFARPTPPFPMFERDEEESSVWTWISGLFE